MQLRQYIAVAICILNICTANTVSRKDVSFGTMGATCISCPTSTVAGPTTLSPSKACVDRQSHEGLSLGMSHALTQEDERSQSTSIGKFWLDKPGIEACLFGD
jgi:hypothetical protein